MDDSRSSTPSPSIFPSLNKSIDFSAYVSWSRKTGTGHTSVWLLLLSILKLRRG